VAEAGAAPCSPSRQTSAVDTLFSELIVILALILANGVLSGAEIAVVSLRRTRIEQLLDERRAGADALAGLRAQPERFLATVQIGITVISTTAAAFGGSTLARHLVPLITRVDWLATHAQPIALAIVVAAISYLSLVLGELVPKSLALRVGESYALAVARPLRWLSSATNPLVVLLTATSNLILKPFRDRTNFMEARLSREELQLMVDEAAKTGTLDQHVGEIASRAIAFDQLALADVAIPRDHIDALPRNATEEQIRRFMLEERRSRIPVYEGALDNLVGYVSAKDIISIAWEGKLVVLEDLLRPLKMFPETTPAIDVLRSMRRERHRIAAAVDEHGSVTGIVTVEDLVEELVGEVFSEHEEARPQIVRGVDGSALVRGDVPLRDVNRELGLSLETDSASTIAGLATQLAGGLPNRRARLAAHDGTVLEIVDVGARVVRSVRLIPPPSAEHPAADTR
jgi:putative hemolysin